MLVSADEKALLGAGLLQDAHQQDSGFQEQQACSFALNGKSFAVLCECFPGLLPKVTMGGRNRSARPFSRPFWWDLLLPAKRELFPHGCHEQPTFQHRADGRGE